MSGTGAQELAKSHLCHGKSLSELLNSTPKPDLISFDDARAAYASSRNSECTHLASFGSSGTIHVFSWDRIKGPGSKNDCPDEEFEHVCDERASRAADEPKTSLLGRIRTIGKGQRKHRSFAQLRWKHFARATPPANQEALTLFMHGSDANLVLFSMTGLLWRYNVSKDGVFSLKITEDVFE